MKTETIFTYGKVDIADELIQVYNDMGLIGGRSADSRFLYKFIEQYARTDLPVLVLGEPGTGKELVARALHQSGTRQDKPFVPVNCAELKGDLLGSTLFGHEKGAYTGADRKRDGLFRSADGGTLFLDEIGEMSGEVQAQLLRVIEYQEFRPMGSDKIQKVDVRLVLATNRQLHSEEERQQLGFREDLYGRVGGNRIHVPPLRARTMDFSLLLLHFIKQFRPPNAAPIEYCTWDFLWTLARYSWPGNVRELRNTIESICQTMDKDGDSISRSDLPRSIQSAYVPYYESSDLHPFPYVPQGFTKEIKEALSKYHGESSWEHSKIPLAEVDQCDMNLEEQSPSYFLEEKAKELEDRPEIESVVKKWVDIAWDHVRKNAVHSGSFKAEIIEKTPPSWGDIVEEHAHRPKGTESYAEPVTDTLNLKYLVNQGRTLEQVEQEYIRAVLEHRKTNGEPITYNAVGKVLGITHKTVQSKVKKYSLQSYFENKE